MDIKNLLSGHDTAASWAYQLLLSLTAPDKNYDPASLRELVVSRLGPLLQEGRLGDAVKLRIGKVTQHALCQCQLTVHLVSRLRALFTLHHFGPDAFQISGIGGQFSLANQIGRAHV